jgi:hypothetical protein
VGWVDATNLGTLQQSIIKIANLLGEKGHNFTQALECVSKKEQLLLVIHHYHSGLHPLPSESEAKKEKTVVTAPTVNSSNVASSAKEDALWLSNEDFAFFIKQAQCHVVYICEHSVVPELRQVGLDVASVKVGVFKKEEIKALIKLWLPAEEFQSLQETDIEKIHQMTGGFPAIATLLCQEYEKGSLRYRNFMEFLNENAEVEIQRFFQKQVQKNLEKLEEGAKKNSMGVSARALTILKSLAYLEACPLPFVFFKDVNGKIDFDSLDKLKNTVTFVSFNKSLQQLEISSSFRDVLQKLYAKEKFNFINTMIEDLSKVFEYLVINDHKKKPEELISYLPHVHYFLLEVINRAHTSERMHLEKNISKVAQLWSSLGRFYDKYNGDMSFAFKCLKQGEHYIKKFISHGVLDEYSKDPKSFKVPANIAPEELLLLELYAREFLFQMGTIKSQLLTRRDRDDQLIEWLKKSYHIQLNLSPKDWAPIAYTLRNLTRALRKQQKTIEHERYFKELKELIEKHKNEFSDFVKAELMCDVGIVLKEKEDQKEKTDERNYQEAVQHLTETKEAYEKANASHRYRRDLVMVLLYLAEAQIIQNQEKSLEEGLKIFCQALNLMADRPLKYRSRIYFEMAKVLSEKGYEAIAYILLEIALPLQEEIYGKNHDHVMKIKNLRVMIEPKLLAKVDDSSSFSPQDLVKYSDCKTISDFALRIKKEIKDNVFVENLSSLEKAIIHFKNSENKKEKITLAFGHIAKSEQLLKEEEEKQKKLKDIEKTQLDHWYRALPLIDTNNDKDKKLVLFVSEFKTHLLTKMVKKLNETLGLTNPMDKSELAGGIIKALANLVPKITADTTGKVAFEINLPLVIQGITTTLVERHQREKKAGNIELLQSFQMFLTEKEQAANTELLSHIEEMAKYAAYCYKPLLLKLEFPDIKVLAKTGAERVINYQKSGNIHFSTPLQELVIMALAEGEGNHKLSYSSNSGKKSKVWDVHGFFAKPGVMESSNADVYIPNAKFSRPDIYGYRLGSPLEIKNHNYAHCKDSKEAEEKVKEAHQKNGCVVM